MTITFDHQNLIHTVISSEKPIIFISRAAFITEDKNWIKRLINSSLSIKIACVKEKGEMKSTSDVLVLGSFITPYSKLPELEINRLFSFTDTFKMTGDRECENWITTIELRDSNLKMNEKIDISVIDKEHINRRLNDWIERVKNLYSEIKMWLPLNYLLEIGTQTTLFEEMMQRFNIDPIQMDTATIYFKKKHIMSLKPKGLWIIGANGRIDILTKKGGHMLVDKADQFEPPRWHIYKQNDYSIGKPFTNQEFLNIIELY